MCSTQITKTRQCSYYIFFFKDNLGYNVRNAGMGIHWKVVVYQLERKK